MKYILAVDDEQLNLNIINELLSDDYEVHTAEDGVECLKSIEKRTPDLLLLDVGMPKLNGLDVCKKLREQQKYKNLPIIFLSAFAAEEDMVAGINAGADKYISKPFKPLELLDIVNLMLNNE